MGDLLNMSSSLFRIGSPHPASMKAVLLPSAVAFLLLQPWLAAREPWPAIKQAVAPKYPALTLAGRVYGEVNIRVTIDRSGNVREASVIDGHPMLREAATAAARQWKFASSTVPERTTTLEFRFVLLPETAEVSSQVVFLPPNGFEIRQKPPSAELQDGGVDEPAPVADPIAST